MVHLKELRQNGVTYLSLVDEENDAPDSGTCLINRESLRDLDGSEASLVSKKCFEKAMSKKLETELPDTSANHILKSTFEAKSDSSNYFSLLGRDIISGCAKWSGNYVKMYGGFSYIEGYWEWTEDVLSRYSDILASASIDSAVYASLYTYNKDARIIRAFCECWCHTTNTLHTKEGELSISLWDLQKLGGLPVNGEIYDETVPQLKRFMQRDGQGNRLVPGACSYLFTAFRRLVRRAKNERKVTAEDWIRFWCKRAITYKSPNTKARKTSGLPKKTQNPSGELPTRPTEWAPAEQAMFDKVGVNKSYRDRVYLAAFLSCWLCVFVLPESEERKIRPCTFEIASLLAEGNTFSLAIPVLASIYRGLNEMVKSSSPAFSRSYFPAHYLYGWLAHYFSAYHKMQSPPPGPSMVAYSGVQGAKAYTDDEARDLIYGGREVNANCFILHPNKVEVLRDDDNLDSIKFGYLVSLRSSYLPFRLGESFYLEPYNPHRFSRQFGFCQDVPDMLARASSQRRVTNREALKFWQLLLFSKSYSTVVLPSSSIRWYERSTTKFREWWGAAGIGELRKDIKKFLLTSCPGKEGSDPHVDKEGPNGKRPLKSRHNEKCKKTSIRARDGYHSDAASDVDPKHGRGEKRKAHVIDTNDEEVMFAGVSSASRVPSLSLQGDVALEVGTSTAACDFPGLDLDPPTREYMPRKGKELSKFKKISSSSDSYESGSREGHTGSSVVGASEASVLRSPIPVTMVSPCNLRTGSTPSKFVNVLDPPEASFRPSSPYEGIFTKALRGVATVFTTKLKNADFSEVEAVAAKAKACYAGIRQLKGDPTLLEQQVNSYVGAVNAYLVLQQLAAERHRPESLERDKLQQHQKLEEVKAHHSKVQKDLEAESLRLLDTQKKITSLVAELKQAQEMETELQQSMAAKVGTLTDLESQVETTEKTLEELEATPVLSAEEEASIEEQRASLEQMRASIYFDP